MILAAGLVLLAATAVADPERGERLFAEHCHACHSLRPGETGLPGPNLAGVAGRRAAALPDFDYSPALRRRAGEGLVWTNEALDAFLADPGALVPGTDMTFVGLQRADERAALVVYLSGATAAP